MRLSKQVEMVDDLCVIWIGSGEREPGLHPGPPLLDGAITESDVERKGSVGVGVQDFLSLVPVVANDPRDQRLHVDDHWGGVSV